jgi:CBS domain containing-hemolysin-like protein
VSGFFTLFKESLKAARKTRLQKEADGFGKRRGGEKYRRVLEAVQNPDKYLANGQRGAPVLRTP